MQSFLNWAKAWSCSQSEKQEAGVLERDYSFIRANKGYTGAEIYVLPFSNSRELENSCGFKARAYNQIMPRKTKKTAKKAVKKAKKPARKAVRKVSAKPAKAPKPIGAVTHFYGNIKVAVIKFSAPPKLGGEVHFKGATTDFKQALMSAQVDHEAVSKIPKGKLVGVKVRSKVRQGDKVYA